MEPAGQPGPCPTGPEASNGPALNAATETIL